MEKVPGVYAERTGITAFTAPRISFAPPTAHVLVLQVARGGCPFRPPIALVSEWFRALPLKLLIFSAYHVRYLPLHQRLQLR